MSSGDYLQTLGVRLKEGRMIQASDNDQAPPVVVINETLARLYFPKESALGHKLVTSARQPVWQSPSGRLFA